MAVNSFTDALGKKGFTGSKVYNQLLMNEEIPKEKVKTIEAIKRHGKYTLVKLEGEEGFASSKNYIIIDDY